MHGVSDSLYMCKPSRLWYNICLRDKMSGSSIFLSLCCFDMFIRQLMYNNISNSVQYYILSILVSNNTFEEIEKMISIS